MEEIDISEAIDFMRELSEKKRCKVKEVSAFSSSNCTLSKRPPRAWKLLDHPGAYYVQNALDDTEQKELIAHCVKILPEQPNKTNHWQRLGLQVIVKQLCGSLSMPEWMLQDWG